MIAPSLLVSVRNVPEAKSAIEGGAGIVDVKEPNRGSLGMADPSAIREITAAVAIAGRELSTSAALGDAVEWNGDSQVGNLPAELAYAKLGLAGWARHTAWRSDWHNLRNSLDASSGRRFNWIAVAYADWQDACAPPPVAVIEAAGETHCAGVLFDTFCKDGRTLLDCLRVDELAGYSSAVHSSGMMLALAGSLHRRLLPPLMQFAPDIIGIRSAACRHGERDGDVCATAVREFRDAMQRAVDDRQRSLA